MENKVIAEGKTTNEAIENGLKILKVSKNKVNIKVLESEDKRSFFSILAPRVVKVELTLKEKEDGKLMAILSYVGVLSLVPYLAEKDNKWVRYHAIQGVNLFIIEVIFYIIRVIPILGWIVGWLGSIVTLVISIIGIVNACNGETKELPIVGKIKFIKQ